MSVAEALSNALSLAIAEELKESFDRGELEVAKLVHGLLKTDEFEKELDERFERLLKVEVLVAAAQSRASEGLAAGLAHS